jgi:hypothetical protein
VPLDTGPEDLAVFIDDESTGPASADVYTEKLDTASVCALRASGVATLGEVLAEVFDQLRRGALQPNRPLRA